MLTLPHRYRRLPPRDETHAPWPSPPRSVVAHLELAEPTELAPPYAEPDPRFELWLEVEGRWQMVRFGAGGAVTRAAWVLPFHRCIPTPDDDLDEAPPQSPQVARELEAAAQALAERATVRMEGDAETLATEVERVRPFYTGVGLSLRLEGEAPRREVEAALGELGLRPASYDERLFQLDDRDAGEWEPLLSVRLEGDDDEVTSLRVVVDLEVETVAPEARMELAMEAADTLARRFDLRLREEITGLTDPDAILDAATQSLALLDADGRLDAFEALPRPLPLADRDARRVGPNDPPGIDLTGHVLVFDVASGTRQTSLLWFALAAAATVFTLAVHILGLFVAMGAIAMAVRALPAQGKARVEFDALHVDLDGDQQRYPFPWTIPTGLSEAPWTDAEGTPIQPSPPTFPAAVRQALAVRSRLHGAPLVELLAHEACWLHGPAWRGRRDGWIGVAFTPDLTEALGVFPYRELYDAFAASGAPHRLVGAYAEDASGKGASVGLPTDIDPELDPSALAAKEEAFA